MKTYKFVVRIEAKNEKEAKKEFSNVFDYDFASIDNWYAVDVIEDSEQNWGNENPKHNKEIKCDKNNLMCKESKTKKNLKI